MRTRKAFVIAGLWAFLIVVAVHFIQFPGSVPDFNRASDGGILLDASPALLLTGSTTDSRDMAKQAAGTIRSGT